MTLDQLEQFLAKPSRRIHLIGVAGSGMSGIAGLLLALGHRVSGSDRVDSQETLRLVSKGLDFHMPHTAECVQDAELIIYSSAVKIGNPAFDEAKKLNLPMLRRAEALATIMRGKDGVIVCGTHGKTTTSAMAAHVLRSAGQHPSHYVGAEIPILGTNARWDSEGTLFVAEGDESDGTLINYRPRHTIVLNIEAEHLDFYRELQAIDAVFERLCHQTSDYIIYCGDDPGATRVCSKFPSAVSYGRQPQNQFRLENLETSGFRSAFDVIREGTSLGRIELNIPGVHNAINALAVAAFATLVGVPFEDICKAMASFQGARRRFEVRYQSPANIVVDDYGHHPTEIAATIATARSGSWQRVITAFQPHRFSRTLALKDDFGRAFEGADSVIVADIYPASEQPIPGVSSLTIVDSAKAQGHPSISHHSNLTTLHKALAPLVRDGDLVLTLGAGNIHEVATRLIEDLKLRDKLSEIEGSGSISLHEPLSKHTTMRIGGPARFWIEPETVDGFCELVRFCTDSDLPLHIIGRGSNLLVRDGGIDGVVVHLSRGEFASCSADGEHITAGVGVRMKQLAATAKLAKLGGFEWMDGIPGNLGGGLRMNAGAMGIQMFDQVVRLTCCDPDGNLRSLTPEQVDIHYRNIPTLKELYAVSATLKGHPATVEEIQRELSASEVKRKESQPIAASAGCIFKNPGGIAAGKLIDELGLKNFTVGKARVSEVHGNFIVNDGGATAEEVLTLIEEIQAAARHDRGIELETEVQIIGVDA